MDESVSIPSGSETRANPTTARDSDIDAAAELARARERLAFYESFDALIQENVQRSGELLRRVAAEQEETDRKLRAKQAEVDQRLAEQRSVLEAIASDVTGLQSALASLASRIEASLVGLPPTEPEPVSNAGSPTVDDEPTPPPVVSSGGPAAGGEPVSEASQPAMPSAPESPAQASVPNEPFASGLSAEPAAVALGEPEAVAAVAAPAAPQAKPDKVDLIIHGVPNAATALSLQRHLQSLPSIDAVEVREYVSGVLRFQVVATSFGISDLQGWPGGAGLEQITAREHVLELKLPTAEGF